MGSPTHGLYNSGLWTPWLHLGDLTTRDVCGVVVLDVSAFADALPEGSRPSSQKPATALDPQQCVQEFTSYPDESGGGDSSGAAHAKP